MADGIKFVRIRGKVVPIREDQVAGQRKKVRESASDTIDQKDAVKSLRTAARGASRHADLGKKFAIGGAIGAGVGTAASLVLERMKRGKAGNAAFGAALLSGVFAGVNYGYSRKSKAAAGQYRKDASRIKRGKELTKRASKLGELFQSRMTGRYVAPTLLTNPTVPPPAAAEGTSV